MGVRSVPEMVEENGFNGETNEGSRETDYAPNSKENCGVSDKQPCSSSEEKNDKKDHEDAKRTIPYYKLFSFADSLDIFLMIFGTVGAVANGMSFPLMTVLFGNMINSFGENADVHQLMDAVSGVSLQFVYLAIGIGVAATLQVACWMVTGERQASRIRNLYLKTILRQDIVFFDNETNTGEVVGRLSGDIILIQEAMGEKVGKCIQSVSTFFGGFIIAFVQGWLLTLVMMATIPPIVIATALMVTILGKMAARGQEAYEEAANIVEQTISSIRTVASFTGEEQAVSKYKKSLKSASTASAQEGFAAGFSLGIVMFAMFCGYSLGVWYGGKLILDKGYTGGKVLTVIFAVLSASFTLGQASPCITSFTAGQAAGFKMFQTINRKPEIDPYDMTGKKLDDIHGNIELRNVVYSYPTRPDEQIFSDFSLHIPNGTSAALVGESGSGKSTVISLIERFYDPQSGEVLIDGINLKEFQLRWIRGKIGLVSQEPVLFAFSIKDNIAYGKEGATIEEIKAVSELANASKFIDKLPQGLDTMVGEHGTQLSGGQKQRIAIARAMLKDPRILLLDEATSALDAESERIVQEALDRVMTNRTTLIVAHRLSTVKNADMIVVIHRGSILEKGKHSVLISDPNGAYSQLIRLQEMNKDSIVSELDGVSTGGHSNLKASLHRSISRGSSVGNSSRHSLSVGSLGLPLRAKIPEVSSKETVNQDQLPKSPNVSIRRLAALNRPEILVLLIGAISATIHGVIMPIFGLIFSKVINAFYKPPHELKKDTSFWALMFLIFGIVSFLVIPVKSYLFAVAGSKLVERVRLMCFEKVVHMEVGWFDNTENSSGAIGAKLSTNAAIIKSLVGDSLGLLVQNTASMVAGLVIAFTASWQLSLIVLALGPLIGLNGYIQSKVIKGFSANAKMAYEDASQVATDAVGNIRTVASFSAEDKVIELYKKKCEGPMRSGIREALVSGIGFGASFFLMFCAYAACFYAGGKLVEDGKISFSDVFQVFFGLAMAASGISRSSSMAPDSSKAKSATASVFAILDRESKINSDDDSGVVSEQVKGEIEFWHVNFHYPSSPDVKIFQNLCFTAHAGKVIALVGESGCGKSTVISLLQRFYDPFSGHILLDGIDIQKLKLRWLRQQMGLVSQEPVLFNDTIRANIAYGKEGDASESEIIAAAESANAHKFISCLVQGYETTVGERGVRLSGGQKQRVAIARAIVKNPNMLLLDEATSALDAESERTVQDALDRVMVNRTTIVVAHRLSTIKGADLIAVIKNGVVIEKGNHGTLINIKDGAYASLVAPCDSAATTSK